MNIKANLNRRAVLRLLSGAATMGALGSTASAENAEKAKTSLGLVIYTLAVRRRAMIAKDPQHDLFEPFTFLEYCHSLGAGGIQVPLGVLDPQRCERLRDKAEAYGMFIEGAAGPPHSDADTDRFEAAIRTARDVGARAVRTVILPGRRYERFKSLEEYRQFAERGRQALERAAPIVERHKVPLAVENHKDQRLDERVALFRRLDCPYIGACVDTGNSFALLEDPLAVVEALAPFAFSVHLKDQAVQEYEDGFLFADVALGDGFLDLKRMVEVLRRATPEIRFSLETITRNPLRVPCLAESYWPTFPKVTAKELAYALRTVRANAAAELHRMSSLTPEGQVAYELATVKRCLQYARNTLGL
jgi:sugar phosphate isomerase/epimerase